MTLADGAAAATIVAAMIGVPSALSALRGLVESRKFRVTASCDEAGTVLVIVAARTSDAISIDDLSVVCYRSAYWRTWRTLLGLRRLQGLLVVPWKATNFEMPFRNASQRTVKFPGQVEVEKPFVLPPLSDPGIAGWHARPLEIEEIRIAYSIAGHFGTSRVRRTQSRIKELARPVPDS